MKMKRIRTIYHEDHLKETLVQVDPEVYQAFVAADFCGFAMATDEENVVSVETLSTRDGSRWQDVLHDDIVELTA